MFYRFFIFFFAKFRNISPVESPIVSFLALGEGWHNYHHVFPWDYKTGEFGSYNLNVTTAFIDLCAKLGLATGRKYFVGTSRNLVVCVLAYEIWDLGSNPKSDVSNKMKYEKIFLGRLLLLRVNKIAVQSFLNICYLVPLLICKVNTHKISGVRN